MTTDRVPRTGARGGGLAARVSPGIGIALSATTGLVWFLTTRPAQAFRGLDPHAPLGIERWAVVFSAVFGALVLVAGLTGLSIYLLSLRTRRLLGENDEHRLDLAEVRARTRALRREIETLQRHVESLDSRKRGSGERLDNIAGTLEREKQNVDEVISRLRAVDGSE